ncbi:Dbl homology domain-containing protein [Mycena vulgaris]|nr:Dbl homology domain-containing protein [Mycena vulgaris]
MSYHHFPPENGKQVARWNLIAREFVETERVYVRTLAIMQKYSTALSQSKLRDQATIDLLFSTFLPILNFHRNFLVDLEGIAELPWQEQRWGRHFLRAEEAFSVYEPYCADYYKIRDRLELVIKGERRLTVLNHLMYGGLQAISFPLNMPVSRVARYRFLMECLVVESLATTSQYYDELKSGLAAVERGKDRINRALRLAENPQIVKFLRARVVDWKGHRIDDFGDLLLDDILVTTRAGVDHICHIFLFERMILCCTDVPGTPPTRSGNRPRWQKTPLLLKGRISLADVMQTELIPVPSPRIASSLAVWWEGGEGLETFTLRFQDESESRSSQWETQLGRLIRECAERRAAERSVSASPQRSDGVHPRLVRSGFDFDDGLPESTHAE